MLLFPRSAADTTLPPTSQLENKISRTRQTQSWFFRLPTELRQEILREQFGDRTVHVVLLPRKQMGFLVRDQHRVITPWEPGGHYFRWRRLWQLMSQPQPQAGEVHYGEDGLSVWKWVGFFCCRGRVDVLSGNGWTGYHSSLENGCQDHFEKWCCRADNGDNLVRGRGQIGVMGILLSCQRAYDETLRILYSTNTFSIEHQWSTTALIRKNSIPRPPRLAGAGMHLIRSLRMVSMLQLWLASPSRDAVVNPENHALFVEQVELLSRCLASLWRLDFATDWYVYQDVKFFPPRQLGEVKELLLHPLLRLSAGIPTLKELIVPLPTQIFYSLLLLDQQRPGPRQNLLGQEIRKIRMWYPFTVPTGVTGPEGGGFWLVYGGRSENPSRPYDGTASGIKISWDM